MKTTDDLKRKKENSMSVRKLTQMTLGLAVLAGGAWASEPAKDPGDGIPQDMVYVRQEGPGPLHLAMGGFGDEGLGEAKALWSFDGRVVKGAPYSAQAVIETVQVLGDGNRIVRKTTSSVYRDGQGRTSRDASLGAIGPLVAVGHATQKIFISDPVAGTHYVLSPETKEALKLPPPPSFKEGHKDHESWEKHEHGGGQKQTENLGKQTFDGVEAEGTRTTITIPAGSIGNEQPIEILSERWYAASLQTVVLRKRSDPRFGDTTFRLQNISVAEPDHSLFLVPSDYAVKEGPPPTFFHKKFGREPGE
jgi:hypothetical protein